MRRGTGEIAALWGFAEATAWFVVPDVWLTYVATRDGARSALRAAFVTAMAAALGGVLVWSVGAYDADWARAALDRVPAIAPAMIAAVGDEMESGSWPLALLHGSLSGVPYKIYAAEAGAAGIPLAAFLAVSVPVRLVRFAASALLAALAARLLAQYGWSRWTLPLLALFWVAFYVFYWSTTFG